MTHLRNALLSRADEHKKLLYKEATAAITQSRWRNAAVTGRVIYSYAASLYQKIKSVHSTASEKHPSRLDAFLLIAALRTRTFSLPMKKMSSDSMNLFSFDPADEKKTLAARAKDRA